MLLPFENIEILDVQDYTHDTRRYWIKYVNNDYAFQAGQFVTFDLPISNKKRERYRSYSIANAPNDEGIYELIIKKFSNGEGGSIYIFDTWTQGTITKGRPPQGKFLLEKTDAKTSHCFLCTGVGVAPFRSMIYDMIEHDTHFKHIDLVYGSRTSDDILYYDEFTTLQEENHSFKYHIALSREKWKGAEPARIDKFFSEVIKPHDKKRHYYICGWRDMVDSVRQHLMAQEIPKSQIHFELYG